MDEKIKIIIDGQRGDVVARAGGIRRVDFDNANPNLALVRRGVTLDGQHGTRATRAIPGSPAGFLAVELSESDMHEEGVHVAVVENVSIQQPPPFVEVPAQRDLLLSAVGGEGEIGHVGGNGEPGMNGMDGAPATRESDATPGTNAGRGGDAGEGTDGGDGGDGGAIQIFVDQDNIHLLLVVHWDVRGGKGGPPGRHGEPGHGGTGGKGGLGHKWQERVGYNYSCSSNCLGNQPSTSTSLVRAGSKIGTMSSALVASARTQAVHGGNLQEMIAQVAARYGATIRPIINPGACHCSGGVGNCVGCTATPLHKDFSRTSAANGRNGPPGMSQTAVLQSGTPGHPGTAVIIVRSHDGTQQQYSHIFKLELLDFEVEDENADGIFEPGEHVIVRRIRIRNSGGMPSPSCLIPITAISSTWFSPVAGDQGRAFIPGSIRSGTSVTLEGSLKVLIRQPDNAPPAGTLFAETDTLSLTASMPWLNRTLPDFDFNQTVNIQFPIELQNITSVPNLARGSESNLAWQTYNKSTKALGYKSTSQRIIEVEVSMPAINGCLLSDTQEWMDSVVNVVDILPSRKSVPTKQRLRVPSTAQNYQHVVLQVDLYISNPATNFLGTDDENPIAIQLIQQHHLPIQISSDYNYNPNADVLLITNPSTTTRRFEALRKFISGSLNLKMDVWNVGLYGGLSVANNEGEASSCVFQLYNGKIIIFLGEDFEFFNSGRKRIPELCDTAALAEASAQGTSCLFLGSLGQESYQIMLHETLFPVDHKLSVATDLFAGSLTFRDRGSLVKTISQNQLLEPHRLISYNMTIKTRWYRLGRGSPKSDAKKTANYLKKNLPQERFLVAFEQPGKQPRLRKIQKEAVSSVVTDVDQSSHIASDNDEDKSPSIVLVRHANPHKVLVHATAAQQLEAVHESFISPQRATGINGLLQGGLHAIKYRLNHYEAFMIIAALPVKKRADMAWADHGSLSSLEMEYSYSPLQVAVVSLEIEIHREIQTLLSQASWTNKLPDVGQRLETRQFFGLHLPILANVLYHETALSAAPGMSDHILGLLQHVEASCLPQNKRQMAKAASLALYRRRSKIRKLTTSVIYILLERKSVPAQDIANFHAKANALHSYMDSNKRNTHNVIVERASKMTRQSEHAFTESHRTADQLVPQTEYCSGAEWDRRWHTSQQRKARVEAEMDAARTLLGRMIVGKMISPNEEEGLVTENQEGG